MDKPTNKSNESTISTTGTSGTPPYSDTMENNVKYMNLNFMDNSESSSQAKDAVLEFPKIQTPSFELPKVSKPPPSKILPSTIPFPCKMEPVKQKFQPILKEKTLTDMGFKPNEIDGWENIVQPPKENLYKLLKNMIDNHIKPNVQIRIGGVTFNCHMMVLQCYSDFFMECNNEVLIQLPEEKITPGAFMMVYDWMLAEEPLVQREGILELFNAANFLRIKDLVNQCWLCLDDDVRFREDTAFLLYLEARNYGLESLEQLMLTRICKFFLTLVSSKEFLNLTAKEMCTLLNSNTIGVNSEIEIFMSVVRWLSQNWSEREASMLSVIKCVRFSLMPPWFLVTLNKNTDCVEIDRIVCHPEVKKMINDGISYTTTQLYYGENREEFLHFLERYQLVAPMQRQWVFDKECSYHHRLECPNMQYVTYKSFLEYLEMIQTIGKDYWRSLEMAKGVEKTVHCCVRSDCRKSNDQNLVSVFTKKSRDQGVQVEAKLRQHKGHGKDLWALANQENRTNIKYTKHLIRMDSNGSFGTESDSRSHQYNNIEQQELHFQPEHLQMQKSLSFKNNLLPETQHMNEDSSPCPERSNFSQKEQLKGCDHCGYNNEFENSDPVGIDKNCDNELIGDGPPCKNQSKNHTYNIKFTIPDYGHGDGPNEKVMQVYRHSISSTTATEFNKISYTKILIFGGMDPYCQYCISDGVHYNSRKHKKKRILLTSDGDDSTMAPTEVDNYGDQVLFYDAKETQWKHLSYIPFGSRHHHAAVICNGLIYVIGGTRTALGYPKKSIFEKSVWCFDPKNLKWTLESSLPESRRDFAVVAVDDDISKSKDRRPFWIGFYIIGGEGVDGTALNSVWFYDAIRKNWIKRAPLNIGRYGLSAVRVNNEIWIAGGLADHKKGNNCSQISTGGVITDSMEYYSDKYAKKGAPCDDDGMSWIRSTIRLRIPRLFGKFCKTSRNEVYLVGGIGINTDNTFTSLSAIDLFDKQAEKWLHCGDIIKARHGHDVVCIDEKVVVVGGVSTLENRTLTQVETFCTKTGRNLQEIKELPWPLSGSAVVALH